MFLFSLFPFLFITHLIDLVPPESLSAQQFDFTKLFLRLRVHAMHYHIECYMYNRNVSRTASFVWLFFVFVCQCFPGCLTIQIRTALCILIVLLIYAVAQACVVSGEGNCKNVIRTEKCHHVLSCNCFK